MQFFVIFRAWFYFLKSNCFGHERFPPDIEDMYHVTTWPGGLLFEVIVNIYFQ